MTLTRHMHVRPYVTLILNGHYAEAGDHGRFEVKPGDILMHGHYSAHADWISRRSDVKTLNIELNDISKLHAIGTSNNFDSIVNLAKIDIPHAIDELFSSVEPKPQQLADWPELLASAIRREPAQTIQHWCTVLDLAPATISRGFKRAFGVTAAQYRAVARARGALLHLKEAPSDLSDLAYAWGFSDQPHLTRAIRSLTGYTPGYWQQVKNIQDNHFPHS